MKNFDPNWDPEREILKHRSSPETAKLPEEWVKQNPAAAEELCRMWPDYDESWIAQALAAECWQQHLVAIEDEHDEPIYTKFYPDYDDSQPGGPFVVTYGHWGRVVLKCHADAKLVEEDLLRKARDCEMGVTTQCTAIGDNILKVSNGERLVMMRICSKCLNYIRSSPPDWSLYTGPDKIFHDDGVSNRSLAPDDDDDYWSQ